MGLDHAKSRQAGPWFNTRVMARIDALQERKDSSVKWSWGGRILRPVAIAAILILNLTITLHTWTHARSSSTDDQSTDPITILAAEYGYQSNSNTLTWDVE